MVKIEFEGNVIHVPAKWEEIRLCDYESWFMRKIETQTEQIQFVADICKTDAELLLNAPVDLFNVIIETIGFIFQQNFEPVNKIDVDGTKYFVPFSNKLTLGEYVDIDEVNKGDSPAKVSDILAIVCRPAGEEYNPEKTEERRQLFRNMTCDKVLPLIAFFLHRKQELEKISHLYSTVVEEANQFLKDTETFARNGAGIKSLPIWQKIRYYYLMRSLKKQLSKFSDSFSTSKTECKPKRIRRIFLNK